ncbi:putative nuclease HARBI1 [Amia ocellicauda]|uniref:putative nuclease HARBI1 n=1 Tax=Amia ocellicauda TaxID=2972642 RepID=UPI00346386AF
MSYAAAVWFAVQDEVDRVDRVDSRSSARAGLDRLDSEVLLQHFHFSRPAIRFIVDCVRDGLARGPRRSALSAEELVLAALSFYANGSLQRDMAAVAGISQSSISRAVATVSSVLSDRAEQFITFPSSEDDRSRVAQELQRLCGLPNAAGLVGSSRVRIKAPLEDGFVFLNSQKYHSVHCQMVCDAHGNLLNVENHWPGSLADADIWEMSSICQQFRGGRHGDSWLIGGRSYTLQKHLLTPLSYPVGEAEERYNASHAAAQAVIQRTFGALKTRFQCLNHLGGNQKYTPARATQIINACCVLHNIAQKFSVGLPGEPLSEQAPRDVPQGVVMPDPEMLITRQKLINTHFNTALQQSQEPFQD